ncbi:unnamed protein product [Cylicocyclus nassatus]|uniref:Uncharacterized protein n=1 Tax=Cylicocyclus nassatus TaxID=53992 RepID=A0AA36GNV1_CYLNA|nr:unnamed protein product [Cylicocyclus nassatus]
MNLFLFSFLLFPIFLTSVVNSYYVRMPHDECTQRQCVTQCLNAAGEYTAGECVRKAWFFDKILVCKCFAFYRK